MQESTVIKLDSDMPLTERIDEVNRKISEWIDTLDQPFNHETDEFQLVNFNKENSQYKYKYMIARGVKSLKKKR